MIDFVRQNMSGEKWPDSAKLRYGYFACSECDMPIVKRQNSREWLADQAVSLWSNHYSFYDVARSNDLQCTQMPRRTYTYTTCEYYVGQQPMHSRGRYIECGQPALLKSFTVTWALLSGVEQLYLGRAVHVAVLAWLQGAPAIEYLGGATKLSRFRHC